MISVNVVEIEKDLIRLNKLLNEYETTYQTLFNELNSSSFFWKDGYSEKFMQVLPKERAKITSNYANMVDLRNIYSYIMEQYGSIGDKIAINEDYRGNILEKFNKLISELSSIISQYNHLNTSFCPTERTIINSEKSRWTKVYNQLNAEKEIIKELFDKIEKIEFQIITKLSKITENNVEDFSPEHYFYIGG